MNADASVQLSRIIIPSPREAVGRVGEHRLSDVSRGGGLKESPPTPNPSPPRAARVGGRGIASRGDGKSPLDLGKVGDRAGRFANLVE